MKEIDRVRKNQMRMSAAEEELKIEDHTRDIPQSAIGANHRFATHKRMQ